jgi:NAD(P)-dependent dehydrogenase (short-subunit alcohol dehydrogenase family)
MAINIVGPVSLTAALLPAMLDQSWGRIVNVSSGIAVYPAAMIGGNAYAAAKAALEAHTLNLAAELAGTVDRHAASGRHGRHRHAGLDP